MPALPSTKLGFVISRTFPLDATAGLFDQRAKGEMTEAEYEAWTALMLRTAETWGEGRNGDI